LTKVAGTIRRFCSAFRKNIDDHQAFDPDHLAQRIRAVVSGWGAGSSASSKSGLMRAGADG
jgi:hypothetical protein